MNTHLFRLARSAVAGVAVLITTAVWALPLTDPGEFRYISAQGADRSFGGTPSAGWEQPGFDDSDAAGWSTARVAYPAPASPARPIPFGDPAQYVQAGYIWHDPDWVSNGMTGVNSAYFRREFVLPEVGGKFFPFEALLQVVADDDFEAWINGVKVMTNADFGTPNDRGPGHIWSVDITDYLIFGQPNDFGRNVLAIHATDGALNAPSDVLYEHLAYQLRIRTIDEPGTAIMALTMLAWIGMGSRRRRDPRGDCGQSQAGGGTNS